MRDIITYPIDYDDIKNLLNCAIDNDKDIIGSMNPYIAHQLLEFFENNPEIVEKFVNSCDISKNKNKLT